MDKLLPKAVIVATRLRALKQRIAIAESSTGGLLSSALLAIPGASDYFLGGAVVYTQKARQVLLGLSEADLTGMRAATEAYASLAAARVRERFAADWGLAETGATGPSGNRYGDAPGHCCLAVAGPVARTITLETASGDRVANMRAFAAAGLDLLIETLGKAG
jgi:nicotinamide-nucleotide amidase